MLWPSPARRTVLALLLSLGACAFAQAQPAGPASSVEQTGAESFRKYCVLCHGEKGDGKGPASHLYYPSPANLTATRRTDDYIEKIIRLGGPAMGRSRAMPPWGKELNDEQIAGLLAYLRRIKVEQP